MIHQCEVILLRKSSDTARNHTLTKIWRTHSMVHCLFPVCMYRRFLSLQYCYQGAHGVNERGCSLMYSNALAQKRWVMTISFLQLKWPLRPCVAYGAVQNGSLRIWQICQKTSQIMRSRRYVSRTSPLSSLTIFLKKWLKYLQLDKDLDENVGQTEFVQWVTGRFLESKTVESSESLMALYKSAYSWSHLSRLLNDITDSTTV